MNNSPIFIGNSRTAGTQWVAAGAVAQIAWKAGPNGSRIHAISAAQDDTTTALMKLYRGRVLTDNARAFIGPDLWVPQAGLPPVLALTNTTNSTITRTNGSFIQDGWTAGMLLAVVNSYDNLQNQVIAHPTTVAAGTLTFTGVVFNAAAASPASNLQLAQVELLWSKALVSGCGNADATPAIDLMSTTNFPSFLARPDGFLTLGPNELLIVNCGTLPAANKSIMVSVFAGDY